MKKKKKNKHVCSTSLSFNNNETTSVELKAPASNLPPAITID